MARIKNNSYLCASCGHHEAKWLGHCPSCGEWNTFKSVKLKPDSHQNRQKSTAFNHMEDSEPKLLSTIDPAPPERYPTKIAELDRVLGGGLSPGTSVLLGGEPGIGKSTLMLQVATALPGTGLYVSGEESKEQLKTRADRLKLKQNTLAILCQTDLDSLMDTLNQVMPAYVVVDSIQTLVSADAGSIPGTPNQLKIAGYRLTTWAKSHNIPLFLIAHVTKEGIIAGPKVIEHLVDTVLYFDHSSGDLRILRASKNRMGSVDEAGFFRMNASGLEPINDPSDLFLEHRQAGPPIGSSVTAVYEGSRILLVEIQALVVPSKVSGGRVYSDRIDAARVSRVAAVLERHASLRLSDQDIYINVAGGLKINDTGADLALALALASARGERALPEKLAVFGELTLAGEIRTVPHLRRRIKTAVDSGLENWLAAGGKVDESSGNGQSINSVREAVAWALSLTGSGKVMNPSKLNIQVSRT